jgi:hypothetical protein
VRGNRHGRQKQTRKTESLMSKRIASLVLSSLIAGIIMNAFSFTFLERKAVYDATFDANKLRSMSYEQGVQYAADHTVELTGLDTIRSGKDDRTFWQTEIAYVVTYALAGAFACSCYATVFRKWK